MISRRILALAIALALPASAKAFIFIKGGAYNKGARPVTDAPVWQGRVAKFYVNSNQTAYGSDIVPSITSANFVSAVQDAINSWAAACRSDLSVQFMGTTTQTMSASDGVNIISWDARNSGNGNFFQDTNILASSTSVLSGNNFFDCDITVNGEFNGTFEYSSGTTPITATNYDLTSTLAHEIGHCLGLDHPIEPPTYDSTNTYLRNATMVQAAVAGPGSISRRILGQDDLDGVECIYERGAPFRSGTRCSSYHGTNGGSAITGASIAGGPTGTTSGCGTEGDGRSVRADSASGSGCVSSAAAGMTTPAPRSPLSFIGSVWGMLLSLTVAYVLRRQWQKKKMSLLLMLLSLFALTAPRDSRAGVFDFGVSSRKIHSPLWDEFAAMDGTTGYWDSLPTSDQQSSQLEFSAGYSPWISDWGYAGLYATYTNGKSIRSQGTPQGGALIQKSSSLTGIRVGPKVHYYPLHTAANPTWFIEGRAGIGQLFANQTFQGSSTSELHANAWSLEFAALTGLELRLGESATISAGVGYSRFQSSFFSATSGTGSMYSDFPAGTRVQVTAGGRTEDLKFKGSGIEFIVGLNFEFGRPPDPEVVRAEAEKRKKEDRESGEEYETAPVDPDMEPSMEPEPTDPGPPPPPARTSELITPTETAVMPDPEPEPGIKKVQPKRGERPAITEPDAVRKMTPSTGADGKRDDDPDWSF